MNDKMMKKARKTIRRKPMPPSLEKRFIENGYEALLKKTGSKETIS